MPKPELNLIFPGNAKAVRQALKSSVDGLRRLGISQVEQGVVEIVLAEVLNNIVEHAYSNCQNGLIELQVNKTGPTLAIVVLDDGLPLPNGRLPNTSHHDLSVELSDLPEGGFGWALIKELTQSVVYTRKQSRNKLAIEIRLEDTHLG